MYTYMHTHANTHSHRDNERKRDRERARESESESEREHTHKNTRTSHSHFPALCLRTEIVSITDPIRLSSADLWPRISCRGSPGESRDTLPFAEGVWLLDGAADGGECKALAFAERGITRFSVAGCLADIVPGMVCLRPTEESASVVIVPTPSNS